MINLTADAPAVRHKIGFEKRSREKIMKRSLLGVMAALFAFLLNVTVGAAVTETLAILPFENNSVTNGEKYAPLGKGFAAMLTTEIARKVPAVKMVERSRIDAILREMQLGMSGATDEETAVRAGYLLGARHIAFGSFMVLGEQVRIDIRFIRVETSAVVAAESVLGGSGEILALIGRLAGNIAVSLSGAISPSSTPPVKGKLEAALFFSRGLEAMNRGMTAEAKGWFEKCVQTDPLYRAQIESLGISD